METCGEHKPQDHVFLFRASSSSVLSTDIYKDPEVTGGEYLCKMSKAETKFQRGRDHSTMPEGINNVK